MNTTVSERDLELLSAYLDGQLTSSEWERVASMLQTRPECREILEDLTRFRLLLRSLPPIPAPRNFTLSHETAKTHYRSPLVPTFAWASALSSIAAIFLFMVQMLSNGITLGASAPMAAAQESAPAFQMEVPAAVDQSITKAPPAIEWIPGEEGGMGGGGGPEILSTAPPPAAAAPPVIGAESASGMGSGTNDAVIPTATASSVSEGGGTERSGEGLTQNVPTLGTQLTGEQGQIADLETTLQNNTAERTSTTTFARDALSYSAAALAVFAIISAIISIIFRFRH